MLVKVSVSVSVNYPHLNYKPNSNDSGGRHHFGTVRYKVGETR